ncbi:unnamed protein product, partial [Laminaria digitata]
MCDLPVVVGGGVSYARYTAHPLLQRARLRLSVGHTTTKRFCLHWVVQLLLLFDKYQQSTYNKMAQPDEAGRGGKQKQQQQQCRHPTRSLRCRCHHHRRDFFSSPLATASSSLLLPALLFFLCFLIPNTFALTTAPTTYTANLGMKKAFLGTPSDFTRSTRQHSQEKTCGSRLQLSVVPSQSFEDDGKK